MKQRLLAAAAALLLLLSCAACGAAPKTALVISGASLDREIFTYFLDLVAARPAAYGLPEAPDQAALKEATIAQCKQYLADNTRFRDAGLTLSASEKAEVAQKVNNIWLRSQPHYRAIGVSKQTLTKAITAQAYAQALFTATYDKGVTDAAGEAELLAYFYAHYLSFRTVVAYYTAADGSEMTQQQKNALKTVFLEMAANAGATVDTFREAAAAAGYTVSETILLKEGAEGYPAGFYNAVSAQQNGSVQVLDYEDCIFAVLKEGLESKDESVYAAYRSACITDLYAAQSEAAMEEFIATLTVDETAQQLDRWIRAYQSL